MARLVGKDKTTTMFSSLVSAKLNVLVGNDSSCVSSTITDADAWMATYGPVGKGIPPRAWRGSSVSRCIASWTTTTTACSARRTATSLIRGPRPSDCPTRALARRFAGARRARGSPRRPLAPLPPTGRFLR